jgi:hypothetical protein
MIIEQHLSQSIVGSVFKCKEALSLSRIDRFDVWFKVAFLESTNAPESHDMYKEHIRAITSGRFSEFGDDTKSTIQDYIHSFISLKQSIELEGFSCHRPVPVCLEGTIVNGAHRLAICIFLGISTKAIHVDVAPHCYGFQFFRDCHVSEYYLDRAAEVMLRYDSQLRLAVIWPNWEINERYLSLLGDVYYQGAFHVEPVNGWKVIGTVYHGEDWLGNFAGGYKGARSKANACFGSKTEIRLIIFKPNDSDDLIHVKNIIREAVRSGKHSIHTCDSHIESVQVYQRLISKSQRQFFNYAEPLKSTQEMILPIKKFISHNKIDRHSVLVVGSGALSVFGLRHARDIDLLLHSKNKEEFGSNDISFHESYRELYGDIESDLSFKFDVFITYESLCFIGLDYVKRMKVLRGEGKDVADVVLIEKAVDCHDAYKIKNILRFFYIQKYVVINNLKKIQAIVRVVKFVRSLLS